MVLFLLLSFWTYHKIRSFKSMFFKTKLNYHRQQIIQYVSGETNILFLLAKVMCFYFMSLGETGASRELWRDGRWKDSRPAMGTLSTGKWDPLEEEGYGNNYSLFCVPLTFFGLLIGVFSRLTYCAPRKVLNVMLCLFHFCLVNSWIHLSWAKSYIQ